MKFGGYKKNEKGFTLIELMTTLMAAALLFCLSTPIIYHALKKNKEDQAVKAVASGLANARLRAIHQNSKHTITFDNTGQGYTVVKNAETDNTLEQGNWSGDYSLIGTPSIQFDPMGRPDQNARWELNHQGQDIKYIITLDHLGRVQYEKQGN